MLEVGRAASGGPRLSGSGQVIHRSALALIVAVVLAGCAADPPSTGTTPASDAPSVAPPSDDATTLVTEAADATLSAGFQADVRIGDGSTAPRASTERLAEYHAPGDARLTAYGPWVDDEPSLVISWSPTGTYVHVPGVVSELDGTTWAELGAEDDVERELATGFAELLGSGAVATGRPTVALLTALTSPRSADMLGRDVAGDAVSTHLLAQVDDGDVGELAVEVWVGDDGHVHQLEVLTTTAGGPLQLTADLGRHGRVEESLVPDPALVTTRDDQVALRAEADTAEVARDDERATRAAAVGLSQAELASLTTGRWYATSGGSASNRYAFVDHPDRDQLCWVTRWEGPAAEFEGYDAGHLTAACGDPRERYDLASTCPAVEELAAARSDIPVDAERAAAALEVMSEAVGEHEDDPLAPFAMEIEEQAWSFWDLWNHDPNAAGLRIDGAVQAGRDLCGWR